MSSQKTKHKIVMRKLCPNFEREDSLETVLDVPIPEDMFSGLGNNAAVRWQNMATWMKAQPMDKWSSQIVASKYNEMSFLLYIVGSPLLPFHLQLLPDRPNINRPTKNSSIEASTAKYIVQQYIAATGGLPALNAVHSMCVIGQVKISASEFHQGDENVKSKNLNEEAGGFVLWQKNPDQWCLELIINGSKVISGCNGNISWRQSSNQQRPISKGPPRPLRRFLQGLDPRATTELFADAVCIGEKIIDDEDCFILKLDASQATLEAQGGPKYEIIHHTVWGYFSQRSGLLVKLEDSRLLSVKTCKEDGDVFWETSTESVINDYKYVDGVNIAHGGKTFFTVFRYGEESANHKRELQETWKIEEVDFNVWGLKPDFFMPPTNFVKWYDSRDRVDPISLLDIDESNEWLGDKSEGKDEDFVYEDENLTWNVVGDALGVDEPAYPTRGKKPSSVGSSSTRQPKGKGKGKGKQVDKGKSVKGSSRLRDEDEYQFEEDDEEEEYIDDEQFGDDEEEGFEFDED